MNKSLPDRAIEWREQNLILLDQRKLPSSVSFLQVDSVVKVFAAIKDMVVRGAPAIGITAAYGVVLSALAHRNLSYAEACACIDDDIAHLTTARPTAVNLIWALRRMRACLQAHSQDWVTALESEAVAIHQEDIAANKIMGRLGANYLSQQSSVMTHCNAGALATGGYGTALGVIRAAFAEQKLRQVFACETRPWLQGSRLTAWELSEEQIPVQLICDSAAATALRQQDIEWVIVGADRVAANGDVANKIGTCGLAILARHLGKKFMVVAPSSTVDLTTSSGAEIEVEERAGSEVTHIAHEAVAAEKVPAWNPVFDITPAELIDVFVTEKGVVEQPNRGKIEQLMSKQ